MSLGVLGFCLWQTLTLRSQVSATTDFTLTLTRLAQWEADAGERTRDYTADETARLVAAGDVQSRDIQQLLDNGARGVLERRGGELVALWQQLRGVFSNLNTEPAALASTDSAPGQNLIGFEAVRATYEPLFEAIVGESLSPALLTLASEIRGEITGLNILSVQGVAGSVIETQVDGLKRNAERLQAIAQPADGPAILGYRSSLKLAEFRNAIADLTIEAGDVNPLAALSPEPAQTAFSTVISDSLGVAQSLLRAMEAELVDSRRNVLLALFLLSLCVLLSALLARAGRRVRSRQQSDATQGLLAAIHADLGRLAAGEWSHRSTVSRESASGAALAQAFEQAADAMSQVRTETGQKLDQASALALQQQEVVELMEKQLAALLQSSDDRSEAMLSRLGELQEWIDTFVKAQNGSQLPVSTQATETAHLLARLTAQLELCGGRIERAIMQVSTLQDTVGQIEDGSRQNMLKALNESIKQSSFDGVEPASEQFIDSTQRVSQQLQVAAEIATRNVADVHADLDACAQALQDCLGAARESAQYISEAERRTESADGSERNGDFELAELHKLVDGVAEALQQATILNRASLPEEELLYLKGHALELQLLAAGFAQDNSQTSQPELQS
jgi:hypothetical protein